MSTSDHKLRVVVRKLPPNLPQEVFYNSVQSWVNSDSVAQSYYAKGKLRAADSSKENIASKAYITFKEYSQLLAFHANFDGHLFRDKQGRESRVAVEFAPFQKTPSAAHKTDDRQGTIDDDPDFKSFLETLQAEPTKPDFEANLLASRPAEKPKQTPLLLHLAARKEKTRNKREKARQKQQRKAAEKAGASDPTAPKTQTAAASASASAPPKQPRPKKTRGEKRAAKKERDGVQSGNSTPPIKILARPDAPAPAQSPSVSTLPSAAVSATSTPTATLATPALDAPKGPRGGGKPRGRAPRGPRGGGRGGGGGGGGRGRGRGQSSPGAANTGTGAPS